MGSGSRHGQDGHVCLIRSGLGGFELELRRPAFESGGSHQGNTIAGSFDEHACSSYGPNSSPNNSLHNFTGAEGVLIALTQVHLIRVRVRVRVNSSSQVMGNTIRVGSGLSLGL